MKFSANKSPTPTFEAVQESSYREVLPIPDGLFSSWIEVEENTRIGNTTTEPTRDKSHNSNFKNHCRTKSYF